MNWSEPQTVWSVSDLTNYIRELFEIDYRLREVQVAGEISNFVRARSGHLYFTLKDNGSQLKCVMWRSEADRLPFRPGDGDAVTVQGRVSVYEASGLYQLYATGMHPAGRGDLALAFEQLKQRLETAGLFDPSRKKAIPPFPTKIGIVTSADAAALRDILNVLRRRYPLVQLLIAPTLVQGNEAPAQIIRALRWLDGRDDIDTILIARGGGAREDLWAFNDEGVARAIFAARHPIITGIGHETDFTIADFVADLRAPTPSAAAELAVPDIAELNGYLLGLGQKLNQQLIADLRQKRWRLQSLTRNLGYLGPQNRLANNRQRLDNLYGRLERSQKQRLERLSGRITLAQTRLTAISPYATLSRGYAIVRDNSGRVIRSVTMVPAGTELHIQLSDGALTATTSGQSNQATR